MILRIRYKKLGGHIHCRVFTAKDINQTFAKNGDLVFSEDEWPDVQRILGRAHITPEDDQLEAARLAEGPRPDSPNR